MSPATDHGHPDLGHADPSAAHSHDTPMLVSGLPLADRADDRDGLRLDRLHVPFGWRCPTGWPGWWCGSRSRATWCKR
ncbi:hypothetical protein ACFQVA_39635 [Actinomadura keratinilytica]